MVAEAPMSTPNTPLGELCALLRKRIKRPKAVAVGFHLHDVAVADADVAHRRRAASAVEPTAVPDDRVVAHQVIEQRVPTGVNEIGEQI